MPLAGNPATSQAACTALEPSLKKPALIALNSQTGDLDYCAGTFRLSAASNRIFVTDASISDGYPIIDQESYPGAKFEGTYQSGPSPSGSFFGGFTTIPNTLPN